MRGARSGRGGRSTTRSGRIAAWDTARRKSLRRRRHWASTLLSEGQGTQTPSLAPRAPVPHQNLPHEKMNQRSLCLAQLSTLLTCERYAGFGLWNGKEGKKTTCPCQIWKYEKWFAY